MTFPIQMSAEIGALAGALAKAQGELTAATKDRENPFFKSSYATLASVFEAIREPFAKNGLAYTQPTRIDDHGNVVVVTILMHSSGQWIAGEVSAKPAKNDPQGVGSLISYLKRYEIQAMAGVASADDDDDGNAATRELVRQREAAPRQQHQAKLPEPQPDEAEPVGYDPKVLDHKQKLKAAMEQRKVPPDLWPAVSQAMVGKFPDELDEVIEQVYAAEGAR